MNRLGYRFAVVVVTVFCVIGVLSCGHSQQLVSISVLPTTETFGAATTPVSADAGLQVQLKALGTYVHPPVTKDITNQVLWSSNTPQMVTVNSTGLITATGDTCGNTLITATVTTNKSGGGISSSGAEVPGTMTANVVCFTGMAPGLLVNFVGNGSGSVVSSPPGLNCTNTCSASFVSGTTITLTATAKGTFGGWANCDLVSASGLQCTIDSLSSDRVVTATFN